MKNEMNIRKSIVMIVAVMAVLAVAMAGTASAKSLYVISNINANPTPIQSYDIQAAPTYLVYQTTDTVPRYGGGGVGLAIDTDSAMLFVTYEVSNTIQLVDATTMTNEGTTTAPGASNLAGIVVDQDKQKVYTMDRRTNHLYVYSWDASTKTLTLDDGTYKSLPSCVRAYGLALDEVNDLLYVGDDTTSVKYYNTSDWTTLAGQFTVSHNAAGIAIDVTDQYVYTGSGSPSGNRLLSKYDLSTSTESTVNVGSTALGVAVDPDTGLVYITTYSDGPSTTDDRLMVYDSSLTRTWISGDIGNPTGLCVPGKDISYNPLNFDKDDGLGGACVNAGGTITYTLSYTNPTGNPAVTNVTIVDTLPSEVTYQSCTGGGTQAGNTVTWNIGTVTGGTSGSVTLTVQVNAGTEGTTIDNSATIDSAETPPTTVHEFTTVCTGVGPTVESALLSGNPENTFQISDPVYAVGSGYPAASTTYDLYVVDDTTWSDGMAIPSRVTGTETSVTTDASKNIPDGTLIWSSAAAGRYDIVVDVNGNGVYDAGTDALDANIDVGFEAIPEFTTIMIPAAMILGMVFLMHRRKREE
jgi:uncharacterized repeat protein (TIGR01451 family)